MLLPSGFTPADGFVLRRVLNRDGMNKLSQLSNSVSFTVQATYLGYVPVHVAQGFNTVNRACLPCSPV
jgi:hypothetical protein